MTELLEVLTGAFPSPVERRLPPVTELNGTPIEALTCDPDGPLVGQVVRTTIDSFLGRVCLVRVFSGTLREDSTVHIGGSGQADQDRQDHDREERVTHLHFPLGSALSPAPYGVAGDICALTPKGPGDLVTDAQAPRLVDVLRQPSETVETDHVPRSA